MRDLWEVRRRKGTSLSLSLSRSGIVYGGTLDTAYWLPSLPGVGAHNTA